VPKARDFFTGSVRIINDPRPSGLDFRVYACVSLHDGMSLKKGTGRGCYATFATLTAEIGCDAANLSRSLQRLVEWGYLTEERQIDRRRKTYRVTFQSAEAWRNRQQSTAGEPVKIVGNALSGNDRNPPQTEQHYSSLKELDFSKEKSNSSEEARLAPRLLSRKVRLSDNEGAQLAMFERAWADGPGGFSEEQLTDRHAWLQALSETLQPTDPNGQRAQRLFYAVDMALWERSAGPYREAA
jgi:DNA-binding MarR family transcriptional regulator